MPVFTTGWTHLGGPTIHVVVGLPESDDRLLRASDAAYLDDLDKVIEVLAEGGGRTAPPFVGVAPVGGSVRVVAHGSTWVQVEGGQGTSVLVPPSAEVWLDTDLPAPVTLVRLGIGAPPDGTLTSAAPDSSVRVDGASEPGSPAESAVVGPLATTPAAAPKPGDQPAPPHQPAAVTPPARPDPAARRVRRPTPANWVRPRFYSGPARVVGSTPTSFPPPPLQVAAPPGPPAPVAPLTQPVEGGGRDQPVEGGGGDRPVEGGGGDQPVEVGRLTEPTDNAQPDTTDVLTHVPAALHTGGPVGPTVPAVRCPEGHLNPPGLERCRVCDDVIADQVPITVTRPPLGVLRLSPDDVVLLDRAVLLGRAPQPPAEPLPGGWPRVVRVVSPRKDVSRTHLEVTLDGWNVLVRDLLTTNGTTVALPGEAPVPLHGDEQRLIEPGTRISLAAEVDVVYEVEAGD